MSRKQEAMVYLAAAVVVSAIAHKVASKQAATLGISPLVVLAAGWAIGQVIT